MNDVTTTALVDQLAAAANDAERRAAALKAYGETPSGSWLQDRIAELRRRQVADEPRTCAHLRQAIQPAVSFLSRPDRMDCLPCAKANPPGADHPCDRCGTVAGPVNAFAAQAGAVIVMFGLCQTCATSPAG